MCESPRGRGPGCAHTQQEAAKGREDAWGAGWPSGKGAPLRKVGVQSGSATLLHTATTLLTLVALLLRNTRGCPGRPFTRTPQEECSNPQNGAVDTCLVGCLRESSDTMRAQAFILGCGRCHSKQEDLSLASLSEKAT